MVERREWALPQTVVQRFQPNEYVAACWKGTCNKAGFARTVGLPFYYYPAEGVHITDTEYWHRACEEDYKWKTDSEAKPSKNVHATGDFSDILGRDLNAYYYGGHLMTTIEQDGNHS